MTDKNDFSDLIAAGKDQELLRILCENLDIGVSILDENLNYQFLSANVFDELHLQPGDLKVGDPLSKCHDLMLENGMFTPEIIKENRLSARWQKKRETGAGADLPSFVKLGDGSTQRFKRVRLDNGYTVSMSDNVTELVDKDHMLEQALALGGSGYWLYDVRTKTYTLSETLKKYFSTADVLDIQRQGIIATIHPDDREKYRDAIRSLNAGNNRFEVSLRTINKANVERWVRSTGELLLDKDGKPSKIRTFVKDITDDIAKSRELERAKDEAIAASNAKSEFLANMSHEIRTPMNGILGMAELLTVSNLDERQTDFVNVINNSATALLAIINDILDFSKIEAGALELDPVPFNLKDAVNDVATLLSTKCQEKNLELIVNYPGKLLCNFIGDGGRVRQVITNLLNNAIKFTETGHIIVDVNTVEAKGDIAIVDFKVTDTGIGIEAEKFDKVFNKFTQADGSTTRLYGGSGLGLSISKAIIEMMDGRMKVKSMLGEGSTFSFKIPMKIDRNAVIRKLDLTDIKGKHALIVDDISVNRQILSEQLSSWDATFDVAPNGLDAMHLLKSSNGSRPYDVILLDFLMPGINGIEFAEMVNAIPEYADIPIIMLSSCDPQKSSRELAELGIDLYLTKPVREQRLYEGISAVLSQNQAVVVPGLPGTVMSVESKNKPSLEDILDSGEGTRKSNTAPGAAPGPGTERNLAEPVQPTVQEAVPLAGSATLQPTAAFQEDAPTKIEPIIVFGEDEEQSDALSFRQAEVGPDTTIEILVAEDFALNQDVVRLMLADTRFKPHFTMNGNECVEAFQDAPDRFPIVLMDVSMPVMDGYEATEHIRAFEVENSRPRTPVIALTGHALKNDRDACLDAGMDDYLTKPVKQSELLEMLERWLEPEQALAATA